MNDIITIKYVDNMFSLCDKFTYHKNDLMKCFVSNLYHHDEKKTYGQNKNQMSRQHNVYIDAIIYIFN